MSRFARLGEEVFLRHAELVGEELRLYAIIAFHSWIAPHICSKTIQELSEIYNLNYDHSCARLKTLRSKGWVENTKRHIRPLVGMKTSETEVSKLQKLKSKTSKIEVNERKKLQFLKLPIRNTDLNQDVAETATTAEEKTAAAAVEINFNKSQFSLEECLRYAQFCKERGDAIYNPEGLARSAHQTGEYDAFIYAALYPEGTDENGNAHPRRLDPAQRDYYLKNLRTLSGDEFDPEEWKTQFTPGDWTWLMGELNAGEERAGR